MLGLPVDAEAQEVRRAFRMWAAITHPDQGGSAEAFARLCAAREILLSAPEPPRPVISGDAGTPRPHEEPGDGSEARWPEPAPRRRWSQVLTRPTPRTLVFTTLLVLFALAGAAAAAQPVGLAVAAFAATGACVVLTRGVLHRPDHGHVIVARSVVWVALVTLQLIVAGLVSTPLLEALPLLAIPFVAAIALVNPGAGLRMVNVR